MKLAAIALLAIALLAVAPMAQANLDIANIGDITKVDAKIIAGFGSYHYKAIEREMLNQSNPAIGFEAWDIQVVYTPSNSWGNDSAYVSYTPDYEINKYLTLSANIGFATNYECDNSISHEGIKLTTGYCSDSGVVPLVGASIDYSPFANNFAVSVGLTHTVAMFSVNYKL